MIMKCRKCHEIDQPYGALFCHMCGAILEQSINEPIKTTEKNCFDWAENFSEGFAFVAIGGKAGFINKKGRIAINPRFNIEGCYSFGQKYKAGFSHGLAIVSIGDYPDRRYGCIDYSGNFVIQPKYDCIWPFTEGLAPARMNGKWGFINNRGQIIIEPKYEKVCHFSEGLASVGIEWGKMVYIDNTGQVVLERTKNIIPCWDEGFSIKRASFSWAGSFYDGLARIECAGKAGYINKTGKFHKLKFNTICDFSEGLAAFAVNSFSKCGFIDRSFNVVIEPQFDGQTSFHNGLAVVCQGKKSGYIDKFGKIIIQCQFDNAAPFYEGLAAVEIDKKIGYIDSKGKMVIPPRFHSARNFSEGMAAVEENGEWGFIDKSGKYVF